MHLELLSNSKISKYLASIILEPYHYLSCMIIILLAHARLAVNFWGVFLRRHARSQSFVLSVHNHYVDVHALATALMISLSTPHNG